MYQIVWPRGNKTNRELSLARRLDTLEGKTIGELWDWFFRGDEVFPVVRRELAKRYPGVKFVTYEAFGSTHGGEEGKVIAALKDKLREYKCDAVLSSMGC